MWKVFFFLIALIHCYPMKVIATCICPFDHPQDLICRSKFVGTIRITALDLQTQTDHNDPGRIIAGSATILKVFKGKYEDFDEGSSVYLYTPSTVSACRRNFEPGEYLVAGLPHRGGLHMNKCDLMKLTRSFNETQLLAIKSHIRNRAYIKGCGSCSIKKPLDYKSYVRKYQCPPHYEFPISTSACLPSGPGGRCKWTKKSVERFQHPSPLFQKKGSNTSEPVIKANTDTRTLLKSLLALRDAAAETSHTTVVEEAPAQTIETKEKSVTSPTSSSFPLSFENTKIGEDASIASEMTTTPFQSSSSLASVATTQTVQSASADTKRNKDFVDHVVHVKWGFPFPLWRR